MSSICDKLARALQGAVTQTQGMELPRRWTFHPRCWELLKREVYALPFEPSHARMIQDVTANRIMGIPAVVRQKCIGITLLTAGGDELVVLAIGRG